MLSLHEYEIAILNALKKQSPTDLDFLLDNLGINRDSIIWAIENLNAAGAIKVEREHQKVPKISEEGKSYLKIFPEEELVAALRKSGGKLQAQSAKNEIGVIWAKRNNWITIDKGEIKFTDKGEATASGGVYPYRVLLNKIANSDPSSLEKIIEENTDMVNNLKKRDILEIMDKGNIKRIEITEKGASIQIDQGIGTLTREMITTGKWEKEKFRRYDILAPSEEIFPARLHPMHEFIDIIRSSWLNMGFTEISGPIIESAFWNFDALFSPQDHPTRDMQDTFFLKNPKKIDIDDIALMNRVKKMHVKNWKESWKAEIAQQALLRTHTTSVSARYINKLANEAESSFPLKFFSVGRIFRNESIDYKHLAEFYQTDGIIIGNNLTLSNLMYVLKGFYNRLNIDAKFKPSYFPFVEPGLECYYYDKSLDDEIELCGGGIIRKEITKAMGTNKTVLAWGGGVERLTFGSLGIESITDLYKNDIGSLRKRKELNL